MRPRAPLPKRRLDSLSAAQARRIALAAQGFGVAHPAHPGRAHLRTLFARLGVVQIDSVNVLVRSHYLPIFSRLGSYDPALLDALAYGPKRDLFEYWGHEASLLPLTLQPLLRWRMERARAGRGMWGGITRMGRYRRAFVEAVLREVTERGPLSAGELSEQRGKRRGPWWGRSDAKVAIEWLFWAGFVTTAFRRGFERVYDLPERVFPRAVLDAPTPPEAQAHRELIKIAARAFGVATANDLRDYYRLDLADTKRAISDLVSAGELQTLAVEGWKVPCYAPPDLRLVRSAGASALLSPFDSLVWERSRAERLFGFAYRIEIYIPAHKRVHGYYVLPFLLGERFAARVDLKSERVEKRLCVKSVHFEEGMDVPDAAQALAAELHRMAQWLGHDAVSIEGRSRAAVALRAALRSGV